MKVSLKWLNDFVDIDVDVNTLADKLVSAGFEVEEIIDQASKMKNVILGQIKKITKHPDSDHLQICQIDVGSGELIQIVTGAQNIAENDLVPVAMHNSLLPTGQEIKRGKLRGVDSNGMLCSGEELCLTENDYEGASVYGIMIMNKETAPLGTDLNKIFGNDDVILDIGVTANRPDCNSILGIAREVATVLNKPLKMPDISFSANKNIKIEDIVKVDVKDTDLCPRYMAGAVTNIKIAPSPEYISSRLKSVGLRSINNIVDITNFVLIEIGQPMHAFDQDFLEGNQINVRRAVNGEKIITLDEKEHVLNDSMLVICDAVKPACMAGIMGGLNSGIKDTTKTVVFESAKFARDNIRRTSRALNLRSDSSFRYERGIDFDSQRLGLARALHLIQEFNCGDIADGIIDKLATELKPNVINTTVSTINSILGIEVPADTISTILNSLQIETTIDDKGNITCIAPLFRDDIENANDLAEEVIRLYGYDKIVNTYLDEAVHTQGGLNQEQKNEKMIKEICVSNGYSETLTYSFISPKAYDQLRIPQGNPLRNYLTLLNPLGEDMSVMRTTLSYSMLSSLASNYLKNIKKAKLFEVSSIYEPKALPLTELPNEHKNLVIGSYGKDESFYTIKAVVTAILEKFNISGVQIKRSEIPYLHLGKSACLLKGNMFIGYIGEVHPEVAKSFDVKDRMYIAEIDLSIINKVANFRYKFEEIGKFPPIERDIAVVVDEDVAVGELMNSIKRAAGATLKEISLFDIYRNPITVGVNKKSVAINMVFRLADRTLTDEEVAQKMDKIISKLRDDYNAILRQ